MNTTLERKLKAEAHAAPPEPMYPCRSKLMALLAEHAGIVSAIEDFEARLQRSQLDLNEAISKDDDVEINRFQGMESVFNLKLSAKRANLKHLLASIPQAVYAASNEFGTLLLDERNRRVAALSERIAKVLGVDPDRLIQGRYLDDLLEESAVVKEIDQLRFSSNLVGETESVVLSTAQHLLLCYTEILRAAKETI